MTAALADVARIDAPLVERLGAFGHLLEYLVAVEMEVADQRHLQIHFQQALTYPGHRLGGLTRVDSDAYQFRAGTRQLPHLHGRGHLIDGIGIGHRLHHHRMLAADIHPAHTHSARCMPFDYCCCHAVIRYSRRRRATSTLV